MAEYPVMSLAAPAGSSELAHSLALHDLSQLDSRAARFGKLKAQPRAEELINREDSLGRSDSEIDSQLGRSHQSPGPETLNDERLTEMHDRQQGQINKILLRADLGKIPIVRFIPKRGSDAAECTLLKNYLDRFRWWWKTNVRRFLRQRPLLEVDRDHAECVICLKDYRAPEMEESCKRGDRLRLLRRCGHHFHPQCLETWIQPDKTRWISNLTCPICRDPIPTKPIDRADIDDSAFQALFETWEESSPLQP